MHISAIVCQSSVEGFIFVNGFSMGPCSKDNAISIPWDGHTPLLISFTPHGGNYLPTSLAFTTLDSLPVCDNIILTIWTGVVEIMFRPKKIVAYPPPLLPDELKKLQFNHNNQTYTLSLIDYCGIWAILDKQDNTVLCEYLSENIGDFDVKVHFENPILLHLSVEDNHWTITCEDDEFILSNLGKHEVKQIGNMLSFTSSTQFAPFSIDYQIDDGKLNVNKYIKSHDHKNHQDIAVDMLSSIIVGDIDYAYSLLSTRLQREFTPQQIIDYIGPIDHIGDAKYQRNTDSIAIAILSKKSSNVFEAQPFAFEFDTMNKINNIMPL